MKHSKGDQRASARADSQAYPQATGSGARVQLRAELAGLTYEQQLARVDPTASALAARASLPGFQRGSGAGLGPLQMKVSKPKSTKEQGKVKDEIEGLVRAGDLYTAGEKLITLEVLDDNYTCRPTTITSTH